VEIWAKYRKMFPKSLYVLWFYKKAPKIKMQTFLFWRSYLYLVLFGQISGNLGKFGGNLGKMALEVFFGFKKYAEHEKKCIYFFGDHFLWIFWAIWGILGKNPSHPQKCACSCTYDAPPKMCLLLHLCLLLSPVEWSYVNTAMRKFESSQKHESRTQPDDSSKAYRKPRAFNCEELTNVCESRALTSIGLHNNALCLFLWQSYLTQLGRLLCRVTLCSLFGGHVLL